MEWALCCNCEPPPVLLGRIYRFVYPSFPSDYAGIATASWGSGTTGNAIEDFNCRYVTLSTPDRRSTSTEIITDPVRFSVYGPASDGGTFDYWMASSITGFTQLRLYQFGPNEHGFHPVTDGMIPSGSHVEWSDNELSLDITTSGIPTPAFAQSTEPNLYNVDGLPHTLSIHAFAHRVNGSTVGSVHVAPFSAADYICPIADGDTYEVDVWYKMAFTASGGLPATYGYVNRWLHTTRVSNGSRRLTQGQRPSYMINFQNANFIPAFNPTEHTYEISIAGQVGWTLLSGSNGPITIENYANVWDGSVGDSFALMRAKGTQPIFSITLFWDREVAVVIVQLPGTSIFAPRRQYLYRSTTVSAAYRSETVSTDIGSVDHSQYGFFNQAGTTEFEYVEWNTGGVSGSFFIGIGDGAYSNASLPSKPSELPQTITYTRINKASGVDVYDSGSGTWVSPVSGSITIEGWGAGGGGASAEAGGGNRGGSGGGGGGYFLKVISVTLGQSVAWAVGAPGIGGTPDNDDATAGGATTIAGGTYTANGGGKGGFGGGAAGGAGGTASGGDTNTTGTTGSVNPTSTTGGNGGAGANGGAGGTGATLSPPTPGSALGGGGGGGGTASGADTGGNGASGRVKFTY